LCDVYCVVDKLEDLYVAAPEPVGFFPPAHRKRPSYPHVTDDIHHLPLADGFIPNSVLVRLLFPERSLSESEKLECRIGGPTASQVKQFSTEVHCITFVAFSTTRH